MKNLFKGFFAALAATLALAANAGTPTAVVNATGTAVGGTDSIVSIRKDTTSGNRVAARYMGGATGYIADDAGWNKYAKLKSGLGVAVDAPGATDGLSYDITKARDITCSGGTSSISWSTIGMPDTLADSCGFFNAAKAAANAL
jgi:hypothetical protein